MKKVIEFIKSNLVTVLLGFLILSLFSNLNSCNTIAESKVEIKEIKRQLEIAGRKGSFKAKGSLKPLILHDTVYLEGKVQYVPKENPVNQELLDNYNKLSDSLKTIAYKEAITQRSYKETFENDTIKIDVSAKVTGTLEQLKTDYFIKPYNVTYTETQTTITKVPKFSLYAGLSLQSNVHQFQSSSLEASIGFINASGTHFEVGLSTNKDIRIGIKKNLFTKYR